MMAGTGALFSDISGLLRPGSIAVIGASDRPGNFGGGTVQNLLKFGFPGAIWPVHPHQKTVGGLPCFPSVRELPGRADLAVFAIPGDGLVEAIAECAAAGIRHGIAFAGGFGEAGAAGLDRQRALAEACRKTGFMLCGPNCVGIINTDIPVTATFATALKEVDKLRPGTISMVSQSGGLATATLATAHKAGFGFRYLISSGNEAVLTFADYLHALVQDDGTRVIVGYLEGVPDGRKLLLALEEARERRKPVILIKAGTTKASAHAAQAHTGALAGEDRVYDAIFREMAVIRVYSVEELLDVGLLLSGMGTAKLPKGPGVGIVTFGGGNGVLAADQCAQSGLRTPALSPASVERLKQLLVPVASAANPMDLTPQTALQPERLARLSEALDVVAGEPEIHALFFIVSSLAARAAEISDVISGYWDRAPKPVCVNWPDAPKGAPERLAGHRIYVFPEHARGVRALRRLVQYQADLSRPPHPGQVELPTFDWTAYVPEARARTVIPEHECHRILAAAGISVAAGELTTSEGEAVRAAEAVGLPVAIKGISTSVTHRAAAGLLAVDLRTAQEVRAAYRQLMARARVLQVDLDGVYVQRMVRGGVELLVSAFRDPLFGTMLTCGAGGNLTEMLDDVVVERAPVDETLVLHLLGQLRVVRQARQRDTGLDPQGAAGFIARFSQLAATAPWRRFVLEVNPIKWSSDGAVAVDGLLIIEEP
jgi:acetyltransferase